MEIRILVEKVSGDDGSSAGFVATAFDDIGSLATSSELVVSKAIDEVKRKVKGLVDNPKEITYSIEELP